MTNNQKQDRVMTYRDLHAWNVAMDLAVASYRVARALPRDERFELSAQIRRASASIPANIAEGHGHGSDAVLARHLRIALGSLAELETYFELLRRLDLATAAELADAAALAAPTGQAANGLLRSASSGRD